MNQRRQCSTYFAVATSYQFCVLAMGRQSREGNMPAPCKEMAEALKGKAITAENIKQLGPPLRKRAFNALNTVIKDKNDSVAYEKHKAMGEEKA